MPTIVDLLREEPECSMAYGVLEDIVNKTSTAEFFIRVPEDDPILTSKERVPLEVRCAYIYNETAGIIIVMFTVNNDIMCETWMNYYEPSGNAKTALELLSSQEYLYINFIGDVKERRIATFNDIMTSFANMKTVCEDTPSWGMDDFDIEKLSLQNRFDVLSLWNHLALMGNKIQTSSATKHYPSNNPLLQN